MCNRNVLVPTTWFLSQTEAAQIQEIERVLLTYRHKRVGIRMVRQPNYTIIARVESTFAQPNFGSVTMMVEIEKGKRPLELVFYPRDIRREITSGESVFGDVDSDGVVDIQDSDHFTSPNTTGEDCPSFVRLMDLYR